jgi:hypothetical protein
MGRAVLHTILVWFHTHGVPGRESEGINTTPHLCLNFEKIEDSVDLTIARSTSM